MSDSELTDLPADALSQLIHRREASCREVMQAYLSRIRHLNPVLNAVVNLGDDADLLRQADERDAELARGRSRGWLHGVPQAIKDTAHALPYPTTLGCVLLKDFRPPEDSVHVARMKASGCIVLGKTNVPELALGSHTYNRLFGATRNAWDVSRSAGGSSGGGAVALSQRLLPVADGSDFMGSLRNPAAWNHVFGLRPSLGRVPSWPKPELWLSQLATDGPMGRNVRDVAQLLSIQAGRDPRAPLSLADAPAGLVPPPDASVRGVRIGWLGDLDGYLAVEPGILEVCGQALQTMAQEGACVEPLAPGFDPARLWQAWLVTRHALAAPAIGALLARPGGRELLKPEALWEHERAQGLAFADVLAASTVRSEFYLHLLALFERYDVLALPSAQAWPFEVRLDWPRRLAGREMDSYHRWMEVTIYATFAGLPAISVPAGFDPQGRWPMGLQLIGRPQGDAELLRIAAGYEALVPALLARRPPEPALG